MAQPIKTLEFHYPMIQFLIIPVIPFFFLTLSSFSNFKDVFDQIWAADDYEVFKRLMIQKNIELQLQALQIIQQIHNVQMPMVMPMPMPVPVAVQPTHPAAHTAPPAPAVDEDAIMREVLRRSKEEYESQMKSAEGKREKELQKKLAESEEESKRSVIFKFVCSSN